MNVGVCAGRAAVVLQSGDGLKLALAKEAAEARARILKNCIVV